MSSEDVLEQLVAMSRRLGEPGLDYVILGEGNTSARLDEDTFWVKASGHPLRTIGPEGFVCVSRSRLLAMLEAEHLTDQEVKEGLSAAKVDAPQAPCGGKGHPSVETVLHALCLGLEGINFVAHTHPTAINALTCSLGFESAMGGPLFPDEIVVCGPAPVLVPYVDPGLPLARAVRSALARYIEEHQEVPKVILMQNHGLIALGRTAQQAENITAMAVKAARVRLGTYALGGPRFMSSQAVARIHTRPDEKYRRQVIGE